jgi:hypothetical protein
LFRAFLVLDADPDRFVALAERGRGIFASIWEPRAAQFYCAALLHDLFCASIPKPQG